jgi:hypothetical protein
MTWTLTTWERERLQQLIAQLQGTNLATVRKGMRALDALELTDEEKDLVGYQQTSRGVQWRDTDHEFEVEIADREAAHLVARVLEDHVRQKNKGEDWSMGDMMLLALCEKLGVDPAAGIEGETTDAS